MADRANRLCMPETRDQPAIHQLENTTFGLDGRIGCLIEHASHLTVALRRLMAVVHFSRLLLARADADPRGEVLGRRERCRGRSDFSDDLLRRIYAQPGYLRQPLDGILVPREEPRHFVVELIEIVVD